MSICENCGEKIEQRGMASHRAGYSCLARGNKQRLLAQGWLPCRGSEAKTLEAAGAKLDRSPSRYSPRGRGHPADLGGPAWAENRVLNTYRELRARGVSAAAAARQAVVVDPRLPEGALCPYCNRHFLTGQGLQRHLHAASHSECYSKNLGQAQQARCRILGIRVRGYAMAARLIRLPDLVLRFFAGLTGPDAVWDWKFVEHIEATVKESQDLPESERYAWIQTQWAGDRLARYADLA